MADRRTPSRGPASTRGPRRSTSGRPRSASAVRGDEPARPRFTGRAALLVLVLVVLGVSYASSMRAHLEQQRQIQSLEESIASSEAAIDDLRREKRRWADDAYVETQARKRFGFVMPGETSYQVIGRDGEPLAPEATLTDSDAVEDDVDDPWWTKAWGTVEAAGDPERDAPAPADEIRAPRKKRP